MGKKNKYEPFDETENLPEATAKPPCDYDDFQFQERIEEVGTEGGQKKENRKGPADFYWDLADTRYNIGDRVYRDGEEMNGVKTDGSGAPKDPALKKAYEKKYLKRKE